MVADPLFPSSIAAEFAALERAGRVEACAYGRASSDRTGEGLSTNSQIEWCRQVAARRGWNLSESRIWVDNDISASQYARRERANWAALVAAVDRREVHVVIMTEVSRGSRTREWHDLLDLCEQRQVMLQVGDTLYDPSDDDHQLILGVQSEMARNEVRRTHKRVRRSKAVAAAKGRPAGRPEYGYRRIYDERGGLVAVEPVPEEVAVGVEVITRIARWEPYAVICADLNQRRLLVPSGRPDAKWWPSTLTQLARSPRWIGKRVRGVVGESGRAYDVDPRELDLMDAMWPAVIAVEVWEAALDRMYGQRARRMRSTAQTLWSGTGMCGVCGAVLRTARGMARYTCGGWWLGDPRGSGHVSIRRDVADQMLGAAVVARLADPLVRELWDASPVEREQTAEARRELVRVRAELDGLPVLVESGEMSWRLAAAAEQRLRRQLEELEELVRPAGVHPLVDELAVSDEVRVAEMWEGLSVYQRREVLVELTERMELLPVGRGGRHDPLRPERSIRIVWRE